MIVAKISGAPALGLIFFFFPTTKFCCSYHSYMFKYQTQKYKVMKGKEIQELGRPGFESQTWSCGKNLIVNS